MFFLICYYKPDKRKRGAKGGGQTIVSEHDTLDEAQAVLADLRSDPTVPDEWDGEPVIAQKVE